jgi:hypothetical protein
MAKQMNFAPLVREFRQAKHSLTNHSNLKRPLVNALIASQWNPDALAKAIEKEKAKFVAQHLFQCSPRTCQRGFFSVARSDLLRQSSTKSNTWSNVGIRCFLRLPEKFFSRKRSSA